LHYIDLGRWSPRYRDIVEGGAAIARYKNEAGEDWYATVAHNPERPLGFAVCLNDEDIVEFVGNDLDELDPGGRRVIVLHEFEQTTEAREALFGKRFNFATGEFVDPPAAPKTVLSKATLWRRLTDAEADGLDLALAAAPVRLRRLFEASARLDTADPDYPALRDVVIAALGKKRADKVLAPEA
jgi:hypothetical protein